MAEYNTSQAQLGSRAARRIARGVSACQRCRRRKQKIPRNYAADLEAQVERLTQELEELRTRTQARIEPTSPTRPEVFHTLSPSTSDGSSIHLQDLVKSVKNIVVEPSRQPRFLGQSGGITLARLVMAAIRVDDLPSPLFSEQQPYDSSLSMPASEASLPPRQAADHLVEVYFQYRTPHLPIIRRPQVEAALESAYSSMSSGKPSDQAEKDIFTTYMIFAIALCDVPNSRGGRPSQSEGCFRSAVRWIEKVITYSKSDIETLRAILLLAQFVALCPPWGSLWHLTGVALRLCIDIGLHWETEEQTLDLNPDILQERRCLWYSTYQFDRALCNTLGRPFGIIDESTRVQLPNPWIVSCQFLDRDSDEFEIYNQRAHNHLFSMSKLESEIRHVQHSQSWDPKIAYPRPNYSAWVQDIQPRLLEWYNTIPQREKAHPSSIFASQAYWDTIHSNAILLLHRLNSIVVHPSMEILFIFFEASCKLIASIKVLQREGKVDVMWKSVHQLYMAGLGVIYCLWHSKEIRDRNPVKNSIATLQSCASTLSAQSQTFPGASGCRDIFDALSSATVDWLVTSDAMETRQDRLEFEKQVKDLMQQMQVAQGTAVMFNEDNSDSMSTMLSTDGFGFSEILSSAAEWPDYLDMDFVHIESGSLGETRIGTGNNPAQYSM